MSASPIENILLTKATQGTRARESRIVTTAHGLQLGLARAAEDLWGLDVTCSDITQDVVDQQSAISQLKDDSLLLVLASAENTHALATIDRSILAALIEIQTLGRVHETPLDNRPYTSTDAAMAWLYLDYVIKLFASSVEDREIGQQITGYFLEEKAEDLRAAGLCLSRGDYLIFSAKVYVARGKRTGTIQIVIPHRKVPLPEVERKPAESHNVDNGFALLPVSLDTVFTNIKMPLSIACNLTPGDFIPMPPDVLNHAELHAASGFVVASGKLGQMNGLRALRLGEGFMLSETVDETSHDYADEGSESNLENTASAVIDPDIETGSDEAFNPDIFPIAEETDLNDHLAEIDDTNDDATPMSPVDQLSLEDDDQDFGGMMDLDAIEAMMDDS
jgi:flagellar motor switch protein FliM